MSAESQAHRPKGRRRILRILLVFVLFVGPFAIYRTLTRPPKYQPKYQTIAHRFLDLQAQYDWSVTEDDYKLLDDIITQVKSNVRYDPSLTKLADRQAQFLRIFRAIARS